MSEYKIVKEVYAAKECMQKADDLIRAYIPFIRSEASKFLSRACHENQDEFSVSMIAFHEAIIGYEKGRGSFFTYASMVIQSRLMDYKRKELRHYGNISFDEELTDDGATLHDVIADDKNPIQDSINLEATKDEIEELSNVLKDFGVSFTDISSNSPKQERTLNACKEVIRYAVSHPEILDELLETKKLPLGKLVEGSSVERKTIERHRKYILAMLLIQTNGYEIIRGHLRHTLNLKGGTSE